MAVPAEKPLYLNSPLGCFRIETDGKAIIRIAYQRRQRPSSRVPAGTAGQCLRELKDYFAGIRTKFTVAVSLAGLTPFAVKVLKALRRIPYGTVITYGELAARAGHPGAARAVGTVMARNPLPLIYPCHRVVASGNRPGGFGMGLSVKRKLLALEGCVPAWARD